MNGINGTSSSVQTSVLSAGDENCANGGVKVEVLLDGVLQAEQTQYICNGANGLNGEAGATGMNGINGTSSSVQTSVLSAGDENCANGGVKVEVLLDGVLQAEQTQYICNGANGLNGEAGATGKDGVCADNVAPEVDAAIEPAVVYQSGKTYSLTLTANKAGLTYKFVAPDLQIESAGEAETEANGKFVSAWKVTLLDRTSNASKAVIIATDGCQVTLAEIHLESSLKLVSIPAGTFVSSKPGAANPVSIEAFRIAKAPTTVAQFKACVEAGACLEASYADATTSYLRSPPLCNYERGDAWQNHPMTCVNLQEAKQFCEWIGGRLPTEDEWQYAATHDGTGALETTYPWGDAEPAHCQHANYSDGTAENRWCDGTTEVAEYVGTSAVGAYSPTGDSPLGLQDMSGNVWEWTSSVYYSNRDDYYIFKGGSWHNDTSHFSVSFRLRLLSTYWATDVGFRCAAASR